MLRKILLNLSTTRGSFLLRTRPVTQTYPLLMAGLEQCRSLPAVRQANLYAWYWSLMAQQYPFWTFPQVAAGMYQYFLPLLRLAPVGTEPFVLGSSQVIEQIGIPQLALFASEGKDEDFKALMELTNDNLLQKRAQPIYRSIFDGEVQRNFGLSVTEEQTVTLETMWENPIIQIAGASVGKLLPKVWMGGTAPIIMLNEYDLLDPEQRVALGLETGTRLLARPMRRNLDFFEEAIDDSNVLFDRSSETMLIATTGGAAAPYQPEYLDMTLAEFIEFLQSSDG